MKLVLLCVALVACGGKLDTGDGGSPGGTDGGTSKDGQPTADVTPPPPPPPNCSPITGGATVGSDGSCTATASWTCGATKYSVDCSCPSTQCTCSQQSGGTGSGTIVKEPSICPGCSGNLPALCGFPSN